MQLIHKVVAVLFMVFALQAGATDGPAYWMKSYPGADKAKVQKCLVVSEEAYEKAHNGGPGLNGFAVLAKGNAWEACMEGGK